MFENVLYETKQGIAHIILNRPAVRNALNTSTLEELRKAIDLADGDDTVRAVILTGAGEKAFAAGADINELALLDSMAGREYAGSGQRLLDRIEQLGKPVIAAVNGFALGGGCELAMACAFRIASENAVFGQPEVKLGIIPGYGGTQRLARLIGKGRALELLLTGETVPAEEALRLGLVNRVVPLPDLLQVAESVAKKIMANAPLAVKFSIEAVNRGLEIGLGEGQRLEAILFGLCCGTEDMKEGAKAFLEKRPANFKGR
jgi:enoyl-CoA hydratase